MVHPLQLRAARSACASLLVLLLTLAGCAESRRTGGVAPTASPSWPHAVSYEIFVHAFADGDGDGIGDFRGLTAQLDYVRDLGVKGIWLMPIHPSPSYHKYDVVDYREIHPDYGTMEDFEEFLRQAHARDIRVVMDFVVNHTARDHPWFQAALADTSSYFHDFYVWSDLAGIESLTVDQTGPDSDNLRVWNQVDGEDRYYYAYFWSGMPDLNFDNPAVRDSIYEIGRFWLDKGVDGFRLDAAKHIFDGRPEDNHAFWREFRAAMEDADPGVHLVGEVWDRVEVVRPYLSGLHSLFNFDLAGAIVEAVHEERGAGLAARQAEILAAYQSVSRDFVDATFLTNHDQNRVMSVLDDPAKARVAASVLLTLPGAPYIYYGEEIGMRGMKPDEHIREPFLWTAEPDPVRTRWIEPRYSTDAAVVPMRQQALSDTSMLAHYRTMIALRNAQPALTLGEIEPLEAADERLVTFLRSHAGASLLVVHNLGAAEVRAPLPAAARRHTRTVFASHPGARAARGELVLPPFSSLVLRR